MFVRVVIAGDVRVSYCWQGAPLNWRSHTFLAYTDEIDHSNQAIVIRSPSWRSTSGFGRFCWKTRWPSKHAERATWRRPREFDL